MPDWIVWLITIPVAMTAVGFFIRRLIIPGYRMIGSVEDAVPVFKEFTATFQNDPDIFKVIKDIASQFRTDSGSSLRDAVDQLGKLAETNLANVEEATHIAQMASSLAERSAEDNRRSNEALTIRFEAQRQLDEHQALQQERLMLQIDRVVTRVDQLMLDRTQVAEKLVVREKEVDAILAERQQLLDAAVGGVAEDLAAAHRRADRITGDPGAAADAASQTGPEEVEP
jgi:uncharacterized phage infection (PIP) family protein YhgE